MKKISEGLMEWQVEVEDWAEAIRHAGALLVQNHYIRPDYVQRMIDAVHQYGPYIVLAPGIAFAHAAPGSDVLETGVSLITVRKGVCFGHPENDPVKIIFAIASKNSEDHLGLLTNITNFLQSEENIQRIERASTEEEKRLLVEELTKEV